MKTASDVAEDILTLKVGAQVMFIKNDRMHRWVNGTIGEVIQLSKDNAMVKLENGKEYLVEQEIWEITDYEYDPEKKRCIKTVIGLRSCPSVSPGQ